MPGAARGARRRRGRGGGVGAAAAPPGGGTRDMGQTTRTGTIRDMRRIACCLLRVACRLRAALPFLPRRIPASGPARERPQNRTKFYLKYILSINEIFYENSVYFRAVWAKGRGGVGEGQTSQGAFFSGPALRRRPGYDLLSCRPSSLGRTGRRRGGDSPRAAVSTKEGQTSSHLRARDLACNWRGKRAEYRNRAKDMLLAKPRNARKQ